MKRKHECPSCPTGLSTRTHDAAGVPELLTCHICNYVWCPPRGLDDTTRTKRR